ncbi:MAG: hypothetical protein GY805_12140 [Chloroflexi bacterium]|nr:hypothetical protein [Chloroflexota bacterium]
MQTLPSCYRIEIEGVLPAAWSSHFDGLRIDHEVGKTILHGTIVDQSALHGVLTRIRDLGMPLLLVEQIEKQPPTDLCSEDRF